MSIFLSGSMLSGKLPSTLMHVVIIPLLKYKSKDPTDVNNYWPIAIAAALSKVLEQVLLSRLARYLWTGDRQFGHSTQMAIFALKQTVDFCNQERPVYMCFLDAMWHMPHGVVLLTSPKNNNSCYLLFEQPASHLFQATPCTSPLLYSSSQTSAPLPSPLNSTLTI